MLLARETVSIKLNKSLTRHNLNCFKTRKGITIWVNLLSNKLKKDLLIKMFLKAKDMT